MRPESGERSSKRKPSRKDQMRRENLEVGRSERVVATGKFSIEYRDEGNDLRLCTRPAKGINH